jgi:deazaflavin-dependent oxidoreductase (nitroreductase family)
MRELSPAGPLPYAPLVRQTWEGRRNLNAFERMLERLAASKPGGWYFVKVGNRIDPGLLKLSRGWLSSGVGQPVLLLRHTGAKSGAERETPLLYMTDGERIVLIASNAGSARHPAWYHNLRANPNCRVWARRRSGDYLAHEAEGEERARLWKIALNRYAGYDVYQDRAGARRIAVMVLEPARA